ncbi:hypothetical protein [Streptomyces sp. ST1015]|uniref:hypothetical protein n=1 Tax=Streptomyces sp. ST1015 TaxID=1848900 RepID=UPI00223ACDD2|nr:hypothetical protein [Streptomyces sp. ST1015]
MLDVLRELASEGPVLLAVDGVQWLDAESAEVLAFVVRRAGGLDLRVVAAERVADGERPEGVCPPGTAVLRVPPLSYDEVARIVRADLPPDVLRALQETAAGNPSYARELQHSPLLGPVLDVPRHLRTRLLAGMPEDIRRTLLVASAADRPTLTVLRAAGLDDPARALAAADADGVVRFAHPVVRAAVYSDASVRERREAHALLAGAVADPVERARHLAHARPYEDEDTARTLEAAAEYARGRGEPGAAFELARLAARRTPVEHARAERLLAAAGYACDAGRQEEAGEAAGAVLAGSGDARQRVRARVVLLRNAGQALEGARDLIAEGLRDAAGDAEAEGWLHHWAAVRGLLCGGVDRGGPARAPGRRPRRHGHPDRGAGHARPGAVAGRGAGRGRGRAGGGARADGRSRERPGRLGADPDAGGPRAGLGPGRRGPRAGHRAPRGDRRRRRRRGGDGHPGRADPHPGARRRLPRGPGDRRALRGGRGHGARAVRAGPRGDRGRHRRRGPPARR